MPDSNLDPAGLQKRREVLGDDYVEQTLKWAKSVGAEDFQRLLTKFCWGEVWQRHVLSDRDRSLLCLGMFISAGQSFELTQHLRAARRNGLSDRDLFEAILFSVPYVGIPAALDALKLWAEHVKQDKGATHEPKR
jgi:4-carboxymuconolactone decarboxylase